MEVAGEIDVIEIRSITAAIPIWRLGHGALKSFAPVFFHAQGHGKGKKLFKHLWSFDSAIKAIGFDMIQKIFETKHSFQSACSLFGVCGHKPAESADHQGRKNAPDDKRE